MPKSELERLHVTPQDLLQEDFQYFDGRLVIGYRKRKVQASYNFGDEPPEKKQLKIEAKYVWKDMFSS